MKKSLALLVAPAALLIAVATAGPASAGSAGDGSGYGYGTQPGYAVATSHTACAGHGAFGAFGKDFNLAAGADGSQTGINNSSLCGNPQR